MKTKLPFWAARKKTWLRRLGVWVRGLKTTENYEGEEDPWFPPEISPHSQKVPKNHKMPSVTGFLMGDKVGVLLHIWVWQVLLILSKSHRLSLTTTTALWVQGLSLQAALPPEPVLLFSTQSPILPKGSFPQIQIKSSHCLFPTIELLTLEIRLPKIPW